MEIFHLTWSTIGRSPAFLTEATQRTMLHTLARTAGAQIVLFALMDDHVHLVLLVKKGELRRVQAALSRVLNAGADARFGAPHVQPVTERKHMQNLLPYLLGQVRHHGLRGWAATATGSCFPDLCGARRIPGLDLRLARVLPRFQLREAYEAVGLPRELTPATDAEVRAIGPFALVRAAADALATTCPLLADSAEIVATRRAVVSLAVAAGLPARSLAEPLFLTPRAANRIAARPAKPADVDAIRMRIALAAAVSAAPAVGIATLRAPAPPAYITTSGTPRV